MNVVTNVLPTITEDLYHLANCARNLREEFIHGTYNIQGATIPLKLDISLNAYHSVATREKSITTKWYNITET